MLALAAGSAVTGHLAMGGWTRPSEPVRTARLVRSCAAVPLPLRSCSEALLRASDDVVAAAAVLGENQLQEEEPGRLSAGGCALGNVARSLATASDALASLEWEEASFALADAASQLSIADANLDALVGGDLGVAAAELEDASAVSGCISLAAAAGPSLHASGEAMLQGSKALICQASALGAGPTAAHAEGGRRLGDAGKELEVAGSSLCDAGAALEEGRRPLG